MRKTYTPGFARVSSYREDRSSSERRADDIFWSGRCCQCGTYYESSEASGATIHLLVKPDGSAGAKIYCKDARACGDRRELSTST